MDNFEEKFGNAQQNDGPKERWVKAKKQ